MSHSDIHTYTICQNETLALLPSLTIEPLVRAAPISVSHLCYAQQSILQLTQSLQLPTALTFPKARMRGGGEIKGYTYKR